MQHKHETKLYIETNTPTHHHRLEKRNKTARKQDIRYF